MVVAERAVGAVLQLAQRFVTFARLGVLLLVLERKPRALERAETNEGVLLVFFEQRVERSRRFGELAHRQQRVGFSQPRVRPGQAARELLAGVLVLLERLF